MLTIDDIISYDGNPIVSEIKKNNLYSFIKLMLLCGDISGYGFMCRKGDISS